MDFTAKEREKIDKELAEVEEEQRRNGSILIPFDEFFKEFIDDFEVREENYRV